MLGPVRPEATAHGVWRPATRGWPKGLAGPRPGGLRASAGSRAGAMARSSASRCSPRVPVGPGVASGNVAVGGAHPGSGLMVGGRREKVVAHRRFEAPVGSGSQRGGQRDPAATGERERSEGLAG
jgi:hypothetical protein